MLIVISKANIFFYFAFKQNLMLHKKHFSLKEANNLLPELKIKLSRMIELKKKLDLMDYDIFKHPLFGGIGLNGSGKYPVEMEELMEIVENISSKGIIIKGIDNGLIDFPYLRKNGEEVYLCFLYDEDEIKFWHHIKDGFSGRQSIEDL